MKRSEELILNFAEQVGYFRLTQAIEKLKLPPLTVRESIKSLLIQDRIRKFNNWTYTISE